MEKKYLLCIGIMTGNSIDGADLVLTYFDQEGAIQDLCSHHVPFGPDIYRPVRALQQAVAKAKGDMLEIAQHFYTEFDGQKLSFDQVQNRYITVVAQSVKELLDKAKQDPQLTTQYDLEQIDAIGLHGQTCDHCPPSRVGGRKFDQIYTVQVGNGQQLADLTGITVVYDFRSDDLMAGGEAAPLAPIHNQHLAEQIKKQGLFPITFCNAGNTGNLSHITERLNTGELVTVGWDSGPFNHYPDYLMRTEKAQPCDLDGQYGRKGQVQIELLRALFRQAVKTITASNYLLQPPPKSGDPNYYEIIPELASSDFSFEDKLRTCEYFSAYVFVHSLSLTPKDLKLPTNFAVFGGGWHNPLTLEHFKGLLMGDYSNNPVLPEHQGIFAEVRARLACTGSRVAVDFSNVFGFDGDMMEARIFADMARCRLTGKVFSTPESAGATKDSVAGIIRYPDQDERKATATFRQWLDHYGARNATLDDPERFDPRWSRASAGWYSA